MTALIPTRAAVLELKDELRAMREGYAFLDEKCLLLAAELLRQLKSHDEAALALAEANRRARAALASAAARHGLQGLQCYPAAALGPVPLERRMHRLMRVNLLDAGLAAALAEVAPAVNRSPEAEECRARYAALLDACARFAAICGNLERLYLEYRRTLRRTRALQDLLIPESEQNLHELEARLEELEQEEAVWVRQGRG